MPTNAELQRQLDEAQAIIAARDEEIAELRAKGAGYLVIAKNPLYEGVTMGIKFSQGFAFVPRSRKFETPKPMKDTQIKMYPPAEQKKIKEREDAPPVEMVVRQLEADFAGAYQVIPFDGSDEDDKRMAEIVDIQIKEHAVAFERASNARQELENSHLPEVASLVASG